MTGTQTLDVRVSVSEQNSQHLKLKDESTMK
jgi:hypothetical protein